MLRFHSFFYIYFVLVAGAFFTPIKADGASGELTVNSSNPADTICASGDFIVTGTYILFDDNEPNYLTGPTEYCKYKTDFSPGVTMPMSNTTYAMVRYSIDQQQPVSFALVQSSYLSGWTHMNKLLNYSFRVDISTLTTGPHTVTIIFQDIFGVSCFTPSPYNNWGYFAMHDGDIIDQSLLNFIVIGPDGQCLPVDKEKNLGLPTCPR